MDATMAAEARERLRKWIEETRQILGTLPELMEPDSSAGERVATAEREIERLKKEIDDLKRENIQLRGEKDEIAQAMGQIAQKLGIAPRKSPFERSAPPAAEPARAADGPKPPAPPRRRPPSGGPRGPGPGRRPDVLPEAERQVVTLLGLRIRVEHRHPERRVVLPQPGQRRPL